MYEDFPWDSILSTGTAEREHDYGYEHENLAKADAALQYLRLRMGNV